jgi:hypothetical protein
MHLSDRQIDLYHRRALGAGELLAVDDHLAACEACRHRVASGEPLDAALSAWQSLLEGAGRDAPAEHALAGAQPGAWRRLPSRWPRAALLAGATLAALAAGILLLPRAGVAPGRRPLIGLADSRRRIGVDAARRVSGIDDLPLEWRRLVGDALATGTLVRPAKLAELQPPPASALRGEAAPPQFVLLSPLATVVRTDHPRFRWSPLAGAREYRVVVVDAAYHPVAKSGSLASTEWTTDVALARGAVYAWQVEARRGSADVLAPTPPAPEARFQVLADRDEAELERAEHLPVRSHLLLALLEARMGLTEEPARELAALARENPDSPLVSRLRASLAVGPAPAGGPPAP